MLQSCNPLFSAATINDTSDLRLQVDHWGFAIPALTCRGRWLVLRNPSSARQVRSQDQQAFAHRDSIQAGSQSPDRHPVALASSPPTQRCRPGKCRSRSLQWVPGGSPIARVITSFHFFLRMLPTLSVTRPGNFCETIVLCFGACRHSTTCTHGT